jgi:antitoxin (DNA-binding transcriptional repressor) of toxin-antitoxin stability system
MTMINLQDAQAKLPDLIHKLAPGDEVVITENDQPVARLIADRRPRKPRQPGNCNGMLTILQEDEEHLTDLAEYMP